MCGFTHPLFKVRNVGMGISRENTTQEKSSSSDSGFESRILQLELQIECLKAAAKPDRLQNDTVCLVVYSGSLDRLLAAMNIATGAAIMGTKVQMFFTFWATLALRKQTPASNKPFIERLLGWMLPAGPSELKLSCMHWGGLGTAMIRNRMKEQNIADLDELFRMAEELKVTISICDMSMALMGITIDEIRDYPGMEKCGVATFMSHALDSKVTLFI
jgi:peroxiredoxin family protein